MSTLGIFFVSDGVMALSFLIFMALIILLIALAILKKRKQGSSLSIGDLPHSPPPMEPASYEDPSIDEEVKPAADDYMHEPVAIPQQVIPRKIPVSGQSRRKSEDKIPQDDYEHEGEADGLSPLVVMGAMDISEEYEARIEEPTEPEDETEFPDFSGPEEDTATAEFMGGGAGGGWEETEGSELAAAEMGGEVNISEPYPDPDDSGDGGGGDD